MAYIPKDVVQPERTYVVENDDCIITYYYEYNRMVRTDIKYKSNFKSLHEELEEQNEKLPKHKRKYLDDDGKVIGYLTAKKRGIVE